MDRWYNNITISLYMRSVKRGRGEGDFELQHHVNFSQRGRGKLASIFPLVVFPFPLLLLYLLGWKRTTLKRKTIGDELRHFRHHALMFALDILVFCES